MEILKTLHNDYSYEEIYDMTTNDPEKYQELSVRAFLDYFKRVMADCKAAGKIYTSQNAKIIAYYNTVEKEWYISSNEHLPEHVDYITIYLNSVLAEFEQRQNQQN